MSNTSNAVRIEQTRITNTVREVASSAMRNAIVNCFPEVLRQITKLATPEYLAELYPHDEELSAAEMKEIVETMAMDTIFNALSFCDTYEACKIEKAIRNL
jgi:hypothetical protein